MGRKLTHEEFMERFYKKNKNAENIEILGEYKGNKEKIKCRCKIDGEIWYAKPNNLLNGTGCPKCGKKRIIEKNTKTHEEFIKELEEINPNIEILGKYVNNRTKIKCRCKLDGYEWETIPDTLLRDSGCPICGEKRRIEKNTLTYEEFLEKFYEKNKNAKNIKIIGEYKDTQTKIKCKCRLDGYIWEVLPKDLISRGYGCPKCSGNTTKTTEEFINEMKEINKNIEILGEYKGNKEKIKCRCKIDGEIWYAKPNNLLNGSGCPKCGSSKGEKRISEYLNNKNIEYKEQYKFKDCKFKKQLPFDFYIPSLNIIIEYDGRQHYEIIEYFGGLNTFIDTKIRDIVKTTYCKENNIKLIRIPYWDFDRIEEILDNDIEE